jgi:hypothetical protein
MHPAFATDVMIAKMWTHCSKDLAGIKLKIFGKQSHYQVRQTGKLLITHLF